MRYFASILVVLAMVGMASADLTLEVVTLPSPAPDTLDVYLVKMPANTPGDGIGSITNVIISALSGTGTVHQVNRIADLGTEDETFYSSLFFNQVPSGTGNVGGVDYPNGDFDTHFMFSGDGHLFFGEFKNIETIDTNDRTNPSGAVISSSSRYYGYGVFSAPETTDGVGLNGVVLMPGSEFMQVVIPHGDKSLLTGGYGTVEGASGRFEAILGVPEPGTIMLLLAGALCLVGARFRKR